MTRNNIKQAIQLAEMLVNGNAYTKADIYMKLLKYAKRLSLIDTHTCNGTKYTDDESYAKAVQNVNNKIAELLTRENIMHWYHQSDPRGASLYVSKDYKLTAENYTNGLAIY